MTNDRKIFIAGFAVLLVIIVWMFMRVENLEKETLKSQQQFRMDLNQAKAGADATATSVAYEDCRDDLRSGRWRQC